jgi:single-stranded DNA-binding protein
VNKAIIGGVISSYGVRLSYTQASKPQLGFQLDIEESGFHPFVPCQIVGAQTETLAETLEPGDYCLVEGKVSWSKAQNKLLIVAFGVERLSQADTLTTSPHSEANASSAEPELNHEAVRRPRRRPYPKAALEGSFQPN